MQRNYTVPNITVLTEDFKRRKTQYYVETIFKPPEKLTYPNSSAGTNNCEYTSDSGSGGEYVVIDHKSVFEQVSNLVKCRMCSGNVSFSRAQIVGLGFKLVVMCQNCGEVARIDSSKIIGPTSNDYEVNSRNQQACQYLASSCIEMQNNSTNRPVPKPHEQYYSSPSVTSNTGVDLSQSHSGGLQQALQPQTMHGYYHQNEWQNHSLFGSVPQTNMSMQQAGNWQSGCANEIIIMEPKMEPPDMDNDFESDAEDEDDEQDSDGADQPSSFHSSYYAQPLSDSGSSVSRLTGDMKRRRRPVKKARAEGQRLTTDTPLPNFSSYVLAELAKPAPKMSVVLPPCKAHIIAVTGDEYPTKKEYEVFSLKMVLAFPSLKDPDTDHGFERFKKSLSASFRSSRSYEKNIKPKKVSKKSVEWNPQCNFSILDPQSSHVLEMDPSMGHSYSHPSSSTSNVGRSEDDDLSCERFYADSDSDSSDLSESASMHNASDNDTPRKKRRRISKKVRGVGQCLTSDTPLPDFSADVLTELAKPAPRMSVVLPPCKAHIVAVTGDEYPTKKEYEVFSLKMVMAFSSLKDPDTEHGFERFKKSLSCSFRAKRSYEKNKRPTRRGKRTLGLEPIPLNEIRVHESLLPPAQDVEMRKADEELSRTDCEMEPDKARYLIKNSFNFRRKVVSASNFDDQTFLSTYQHLSKIDMLFYEYSLLVGVSTQELKDNFQEGIMVLAKMFWDTAIFSQVDEELKKVQILVQLQEHFLNQKHMRVDPNIKPLFVIKDHMAAFNDGDVSFRDTSVPCALVLSQEGHISKLMITLKDRIVMEKYNATAFDACCSLLAFFFILNVKYPPVYLDNLKALERLLNKKLSLSSLQTTISSPYSNYVKHYDAKLKEIQSFMNLAGSQI